ncbi:alcohol dehydrogenase catalytic domain-containing protein [Oceanobacter kriegii]|uniref:alcohol dehydrogenase catalytic domain-containing protein n=1 Tax=Oceanobacter kriegii TaxID=64972 RepID=UPI00041D7D2C|nr:zinc-binding dehydrogenase [Oceanobacter kriegii]
MTNAKAVTVSQLGGPEVLQITSVEVPAPSADEVLVKVLAAGFNPIDTKLRAGLAPVLTETGITGVELCGEVVAVGDAVTTLKAGDRVFGVSGGVLGTWGACAEYTLARAELLVPAPDNISDQVAACAGVVGLTALEALERLAPVSGQKIMILGASGGVGLVAVQLALAAGLEVYGTAGTEERVEALAAMGVNACFHNEVDDLLAADRVFPLVLDTHGGASLQQALKLAESYGRVATINARGEHELAMAHGKALTLSAIFSLIPVLKRIGIEQHQKRLATLSAMLESGALILNEPETVAMSEVAAIHQRYESGQLGHKVAFVW